MVLVATRVHGTMTDRQQPKHALTHTNARTSEEQHELLRPVDYARARARTRGGLKWNKVVRAVAV